MKHTLLISTLFATVGQAACDRPTVVNVPTPVPVAVPGPAGPMGAPGKTGEVGTVIVLPPAPAPTN